MLYVAVMTKNVGNWKTEKKNLGGRHLHPTAFSHSICKQKRGIRTSIEEENNGMEAK